MHRVSNGQPSSLFCTYAGLLLQRLATVILADNQQFQRVIHTSVAALSCLSCPKPGPYVP